MTVAPRECSYTQISLVRKPFALLSPQDFELRDKSRVELRTLAVNKNKLWNLTLGCSLKAWPKREEAFRVIVTSFLPRL